MRTFVFFFHDSTSLGFIKPTFEVGIAVQILSYLNQRQKFKKSQFSTQFSVLGTGEITHSIWLPLTTCKINIIEKNNFMSLFFPEMNTLMMISTFYITIATITFVLSDFSSLAIITKPKKLWNASLSKTFEKKFL